MIMASFFCGHPAKTVAGQNKGADMSLQTEIADTRMIDDDQNLAASKDVNVPVTNEQDTTPDVEHLIFGKYKTMEEADKGWSEREALLAKHADEVGKLRQKVETFERDTLLANAIQNLAKAQIEKEKEPLDFETFVTDVGNNLIDNPVSGVKKVLGTTHQWVKDSQKTQEEKIAVLVQQIENQNNKIKELEIKSSPEYQQYKPLIEKMAKKGLSFEQAVDVIKDLAIETGNNGNNNPIFRRNPSATPVPSRTSPVSNKNEHDAFMFSEKDLGLLALDNPDKTPEELKALAGKLNEERKNRIISGQPAINSISRRRG